MPSEASSTLTLWEWLVGTGTMNARIPSTSTTIPTQANGRIYLSVSLIGCHMPHPRCFCLAGDYRTPPKQQKLGWGTLAQLANRLAPLSAVVDVWPTPLKRNPER